MTRRILDTAGERLSVESSLPWVTSLIEEGTRGELRSGEAPDASVRVRIEADRRPFTTDGWELLTRGAWRRGGELVVENVCTAGFDLHVRCTSERAEFSYRWRPPPRDRAAARVLRSRFHLLARAVLVQYPVLWWAGTHGRAPLHASVCTTESSTPLVAAAGGVGRSTVILRELGNGGRSTGDNLSVGDGTTVWGLVEPLRVEGGSGRRMPHGRREVPIQDRAVALEPDSFVVLTRGAEGEAKLSRMASDEAARHLVTSTYMAGELRRYWAFAATLSAGTGVGPSHPAVVDVASSFAANLPCFSLALGQREAPRLAEILETLKAAA
jgi:hypothetical protein